MTVTLQRGEATIIFKEVPADVCENCGEYYLSDEITGLLMERAEEALKHGAEVEIVRFAVCGLRFAVCGLRFAVCGLRLECG